MVGTTQNNPHIIKLAVLQRRSEKDYALNVLRDIAHRVSYLMKEEKLKVGQLVEFYPKNKRLLGMNVNYGSKILLRLRDPWDEGSFLAREEILGTMLHELTHNLFGPHDTKFYEKLEQLRGRQLVIEQKGLFDSFVGKGRRLGATPKLRIPPTEGIRLGGSTKSIIRAGRSPREMAALAAEKRAADNKWCADSQRDSMLAFPTEELQIVVIDDCEDDQPSAVLARQNRQSLRKNDTRKIVEIFDDDECNAADEGSTSPVVIDLTE